MKQTLKTLAFLTTFILLTSYTTVNEFIGKYGVSASDPSQIELILNSDHTFYYQDFSLSDKKITVNGTWTSKRGKVFLKATNSKSKFHNIWTFVDNGQKAKSRKGLCFYSLGKLD